MRGSELVWNCFLVHSSNSNIWRGALYRLTRYMNSFSLYRLSLSSRNGRQIRNVAYWREDGASTLTLHKCILWCL
jgi:hypothetical protein